MSIHGAAGGEQGDWTPTSECPPYDDDHVLDAVGRWLTHPGVEWSWPIVAVERAWDTGNAGSNMKARGRAFRRSMRVRVGWAEWPWYSVTWGGYAHPSRFVVWADVDGAHLEAFVDRDPEHGLAPVMRGFQMFDPGDGIAPNTPRDIAFTKLFRHAEVILPVWEIVDLDPPLVVPVPTDNAARVLTQARRVRASRYEPGFLELVAKTYRAGGIRALVDELRAGDERTARRWVKAAREAGHDCERTER